MTNDKDSAVLDIVERLDLATSRLGSESKDEATIRRNKVIADAKAEILRLRQTAQSDALLTKLLKECLVKLRDVQGRKPPKEYACNLIKRIERVLQEQSK